MRSNLQNLVKGKLNDILGKKLNISFARSGDDIHIIKFINNTKPGVHVAIDSWHHKIALNTFFT
jgi:hypothetical protein